MRASTNAATQQLRGEQLASSVESGRRVAEQPTKEERTQRAVVLATGDM